MKDCNISDCNNCKIYESKKFEEKKQLIDQKKKEYKERLSRICDVMISLSIDEVKKSRFIAHRKAREAVISLVIDLIYEI